MTRLLNILLLVLLAFIVGLYSGAHPDRLVTAYRVFYPQPLEQPAPPKLPLSSTCGCTSCKGHCIEGRGQCQCDPFDCMDKAGCFANCPGK